MFNYFPKTVFAQKHLLTLQDWSEDNILQCLSLALNLKDMRRKNQPHALLKDKTLAMIFTKSSTRTRVSFEVGISELGGRALFLSSSDIQIGRGEPISDTAKVLSRYVDGIMIRTKAHSDAEGLANNGTVPVINGLTDDYHPCQVLADLLTVYEHKGKLTGLKLAFIGDGNNMAHSLLIGCSKVGMDVAIASPKEYAPSQEVISFAKKNAESHNSYVFVGEDIEQCVKGADVVYTDVWTSMGQEAETQARKSAFGAYCVDKKVMDMANPGAIFMHCLPAHRGEEVSAEVIDGACSVVFDEAENRLHAQKAVMALLMK